MCNRFTDAHRRGHHRSRYGHRKGPQFWKARFGEAFAQPPVNVQEFDDRYELYVYAPGLSKSDFQVFVADNVLNILVKEVEEVTPEEAVNWRRREYRPGNFKRQFELNKGVNVEAIDAEYTEGILQLTLHKLEDYRTTRQDILVD